jgi:hypothetical protein
MHAPAVRSIADPPANFATPNARSAWRAALAWLTDEDGAVALPDPRVAVVLVRLAPAGSGVEVVVAPLAALEPQIPAGLSAEIAEHAAAGHVAVILEDLEHASLASAYLLPDKPVLGAAPAA